MNGATTKNKIWEEPPAKRENVGVCVSHGVDKPDEHHFILQSAESDRFSSPVFIFLFLVP